MDKSARNQRFRPPVSTPSKKPRTKRTSERPSRSSDPHQVSAVVAPKRPEARTPTRRMRGLDGLRALAAAAVLAYHLIPHTMIGGFRSTFSGSLDPDHRATRSRARNWRHQPGVLRLRRIRRLLPAVRAHGCNNPDNCGYSAKTCWPASCPSSSE